MSNDVLNPSHFLGQLLINISASVSLSSVTLAKSIFLCTDFLPFRRSTFSITARKPRWIQEYIVLKLRNPITSSGDQVCCSLDSIKSAN